jgi:hypothetical protein
MTTAAELLAVAPAQADCGDPNQVSCAGQVPTTDQVAAVLAGLTDPDIPAANETDVVTPGFTPEEAGIIDNHLKRMRAAGILPANFIVSDIEAARPSYVGARFLLRFLSSVKLQRAAMQDTRQLVASVARNCC